MQALIGIIIVLALIGGGYYVTNQNNEASSPHGEGAMMTKETAVPQPGTYTVAIEESSLAWAGSKPLVPGYVHRGTISLSEGTITVGDNTASGSFTLDMNTIAVTSLGGGKEGRESALEGHLKNADFFAVEEFPTATFEITNVSAEAGERPYTVTGNLTMKGITNEISFPADIFEKDGAVHAIADFTIDRTEWGITFGSGNFFEGLADQAIGDDIELSLTLIAHNEGVMMKKEDGAMMEQHDHMHDDDHAHDAMMEKEN